MDRGYSVQEVADRLGITTKSLYGWKAQFGRPKAESDKDAELRRLKAELARVTEERDILKKVEPLERHWSERQWRGVYFAKGAK